MRYTVLAVLSAIFILSSCSKDKDIFDVSIDGYTLFKADFEDIDIAGEKSSYVWKMEKGIGVFGSESGVNAKYVLKKAYDGKAEGEFYGPNVSGDTIKAYYPYNEKFALDEGKLAYKLSANQVYNHENTLLQQFDKYAGYAYAFKDQGNGLKFHYASGLLSVELELPEVVTLTKMQLSGAKNNLAGMGRLAPDMSLNFAAGGLNSVDVELPDMPLSKQNDILSAFPIVLPAGTYRDLNLVINTKEKDDIMVRLDSLEIVRVTAGDFIITEVTVGTNPLGGYEVIGDIDFDRINNYVIPTYSDLDKFKVVGGLELEYEQE